MGGSGLTSRLDHLRAAARYARERRDLYRAKLHGPRPTSPMRLEELESACAVTEARLQRAERDAPAADAEA